MTAPRPLWNRTLYARVLPLLARIDRNTRPLNRVLGLSWGKSTMRKVLFLMESRRKAKAGRLALGMFAVRQKWDRLARDAFASVPDAMLLRHALPQAARAFVASGSEDDMARARALLRAGRESWNRIEPRLSANRRMTLSVASAALGDAEGFATFAASIRDPAVIRQAENLKHCFAQQRRVARKLGVAADYAALRKASRGAGAGEDSRKRGGNGKGIKLALFDYRNTVAPSTNLGDWIQTIAVIGQLSRFGFGDLNAPEAVRALLKQGNLREGEAARTISNPVALLTVDRDFPVTSAGEEGPIWLPVCGWFGRYSYPARFDFPFPGNIRPLFMSFHIAKPDLLDEESLDYLKRFEPIGCRDLFTTRLLRGAGVQAFFNGCVTMTLDRLRPPHVGTRAGRYHGLHTSEGGSANYKASRYEGWDPLFHTDRECLTRDFSGNLRAAAELLDKYRLAEDVRTGLVHCWLPCRAMGVPVTLTDELNAKDPRLTGFVVSGDAQKGVVSGDALKVMDDAEFHAAALRFEALAQPVLAAILEGRSEVEIYALWRKATEPAMAHTDALIAERNARYRLPKLSLAALGLDRIQPRIFGEETGGDAVHLLFAFDENLTDVFPGTFEGIWRHASRPLVVHVFGRGLDAAMFERWAAQFVVSGDAQKRVAVRFIWRDLDRFAYGDRLHLNDGTTISTMDRLLAPALLADVERVVWLDVDILVRADIAPLFDTPLDGVPLAARRNDVNENVGVGARFPYGNSRFSRRSADEMEALRNAFFSGGRTVFEGFNAGVLVMDLAQMRRERVMEKTLPLVRACGVTDQTALNFVTRGRWKELTQKSVMLLPQNLCQENPAIVHFTGHVKPWAKDMPVSFWREWQANAERARARQTSDAKRRAGGAPKAGRP